MDSPPQLESSEQYTIAWIAALAHELAAATAMLDEEHERPSKFDQQKQDTNAYTWGRIGKHNVVIASLPAGEYGLTIAATTANSIRFSLPHIRFGLMVGIGAGIPQLESDGDVRLGDVVVSQPAGLSGGVIQYDLVKAKQGGHFLTGHLAMPPESLRKALNKLQATHERVGSAIPSNLVEMLKRFPNMKKKSKKNPGYTYQGIENDRLYKAFSQQHGTDSNAPEEIPREQRDSTDPEIHYGIIASGNTLVKSAHEREEILERLPDNVRDKCFCIEMEAAGLMNTFPCMVIRGICDYADENKNDLWQRYAAATAAAFAKEYLQYVDPEEVRRGPELGEVLGKMTNIQTGVNIIQTGLTRIQSDVSKQDRERILEWVCSQKYSDRLVYNLNLHQEGTGQWFLEHSHVMDWQNSSTSSTLFCPGAPGTGKSVLSAQVVDHLQNRFRDIRKPVLYIFCEHKLREKQTMSNLLASLIQQLGSFSDGVLSSLDKLCSRCKDKNSRPTLADLEQELEKALKLVGDAYIVIDALDECAKDTRENLIGRLRRIAFDCTIHLLATARGERDIEAIFEDVARLPIQASEEDIDRYVRVRGNRFAENLENDPELREEVVKGVVSASEGMFLLARLHTDTLKDKMSRNQLRDGLQGLRRGVGAYEAAYDTAMQRVTDQSDNRRKLAMRIFAWTFHAKRQLHIAELRHAVGSHIGKDCLDTGDLVSERSILSVCSGLLTHDTQTSIVRLVHYTTQEYFKKHWSQWFQSETMKITEICITYLSFRDFQSGQCKTWEDESQRLRRFALLDYAANHWGDHARDLEAMLASHENLTGKEKNLFPTETAMTFVLNKQLTICASHVVFKKLGSSNRAPEMSELSWPVHFGISTLVTMLLDRDVDVNLRDGYVNDYGYSLENVTPLYIACFRGYTKIARLMLGKGADANAKCGKDQDTALQVALNRGYEDISELLLDRDIDVNLTGTYVDDYGDSLENVTPLYIACYRGYTKIARLMLGKGADVNAKCGEYRSTALQAAVNGREAIVKLLLDTGKVDVNSKDKDGRTPLSWAAANGQEAITRLLLDTDKVDVDSKDKYGLSPLSWAAVNGQEATVKLLLDTGKVEVDSKDGHGRTPLWWAAANGHEAIAQLLLDTGKVDVDSKDTSGRTVLSYAAKSGHEAVVKQLLSTGKVDIDSKNNDGQTILSYAAKDGNKAIVKLLLNFGKVDSDSKDSSGRTPLSYAAGNGHKAIVELLLNSGKVDVDSKDNDGRIPLSWAVEEDRASVVGLIHRVYSQALLATLLSRHTNVAQLPLGRYASFAKHISEHGGHGPDGVEETQYIRRCSALCESARDRQMDGIKLLIANGTDLSTTCVMHNNCDALYLAASVGHAEMVRVLLENGASANAMCGLYGNALQAVAVRGDLKLAELLLSYNADVKSQGGKFNTALQAASLSGQDKLVELFLTHRSEIDALGGHYGTALQAASAKGHVKIVSRLLDAGADVNVFAGHFGSAVYAAQYGGHTEILQLLQPHVVTHHSSNHAMPLFHTADDEGVESSPTFASRRRRRRLNEE